MWHLCIERKGDKLVLLDLRSLISILIQTKLALDIALHLMPWYKIVVFQINKASLAGLQIA
jgi:hypothetical protein